MKYTHIHVNTKFNCLIILLFSAVKIKIEFMNSQIAQCSFNARKFMIIT